MGATTGSAAVSVDSGIEFRAFFTRLTRNEPFVAAAPALAAVTDRVPHYSGTAVVIGSLVFLALLAAFVGMAYLKRRR